MLLQAVHGLDKQSVVDKAEVSGKRDEENANGDEYRMWENFGGGKFWRINGSKVFGEEKIGESVGNLLKTL